MYTSIYVHRYMDTYVHMRCSADEDSERKSKREREERRQESERRFAGVRERLFAHELENERRFAGVREQTVCRRTSERRFAGVRERLFACLISIYIYTCICTYIFFYTYM